MVGSNDQPIMLCSQDMLQSTGN